MTEPLHKEDIKGAIRKEFGTLKAFEQARDLPPTSVKDVLRGRSSRRVEREIAAVLDLPLHRLFPDRYRPAEAGESSLKRDDTRSGRNAHRLSARAA
ncbi:helix-turn-helix domain-containing protein [Brevundimonas sp.]|uniref:helix-turn-helix domain-containing protein n=1 Tax=Brevundimonas sp. TaxID=1871086 RepID=UPI0035137E8C